MKRTMYAILIGSLLLTVVLIGVESNSVAGQDTPPALEEIAEQIRSGEIDVGDEFGMEKDQRFHRIHADAIGMDCSQCHVDEAPYEVAPATSKEGPVDRRVCLGCHLTGPATLLYEPKE